MNKKALVVVLGELARSPRMQYHCISLAKNNYDVTVIATRSGSKPDFSCENLENNQNIRQVLMNDSVDFKKYLPNALAYIIKPIWQALLLIYHLCIISLNHVIIVQNPPSIPTLPILYIYSLISRSKLIVDWHNYGYTILSLNLHPNHVFVRLSKVIEFMFGRLAHAGFCVSEAMQKDLRDNHQVRYPLIVLYDRPPKHFKPLSLKEKHDFFVRIQNEIPEFKSSIKDYFGRDKIPTTHSETRFTMTDVSKPHAILPKPDRPAILMSSTSWTEDEDFSLLLRALQQYDQTVTNQLNLDPDDVEKRLPELLCVITGKGPLKSYYENKIREIKFEHIQVVLPWLSATDYAKMVGSCDLGVSLHNSSSGVDLPMKVVDLFGCGIPVVAYKYPAIGELVIDNKYGLTFTDSQDLFHQLINMLSDFYLEDSPHYKSELSPMARYRRDIRKYFLVSRWEDNWNRRARPLIERLSVATNTTATMTTN